MPSDVETRIHKAIAADIMENPKLTMELAETKDSIINALHLDVLRALRGETGPVLFPHLRKAVRDVVGMAKYEKWSVGGGMGDGVPGMITSTSSTPTSTPAASSGGDDWTKILGSITGSLITAGATIYNAKTTADAQQTQLDLIKKQQALAATQASQSSMFGMPSGTLLLLGGLGIAGILVFTMMKK